MPFEFQSEGPREATKLGKSAKPPVVGSRATWTRTITADDVEAFARISGDRNPLHFDPEFASATRAGGLIVPLAPSWTMRSCAVELGYPLVVVSPPGLGNAMGALYNAKFSGSPVILTAGQQEQGHGLLEPLLYEPLVPVAWP